MAIHLICPNGHNLTARESNAGKVGKCPLCNAPVTIPSSQTLTESAIVNILGTPEIKRSNTSPQTPLGREMPQPTAGDASTSTLPATKSCPSCEREIDVGYHICPNCHTYLTGLSDF